MAISGIWGTLRKYHGLGGLHNKHLFLMALEVGKSKFKVLADPLSALISPLKEQVSSESVGKNLPQASYSRTLNSSTNRD